MEAVTCQLMVYRRFVGNGESTTATPLGAPADTRMRDDALNAVIGTVMMTAALLRSNNERMISHHPGQRI